METTTLINGNGRPYERAIPKVIITTYINDVALAHLRENTGIDFKENAWHNIEGQPETWEQFSKIFLTYDWLTLSENNWEGNNMILRANCNVPAGATLYYEKGGKRFIGVSGLTDDKI